MKENRLTNRLGYERKFVQFEDFLYFYLIMGLRNFIKMWNLKYGFLGF